MNVFCLNVFFSIERNSHTLTRVLFFLPGTNPCVNMFVPHSDNCFPLMIVFHFLSLATTKEKILTCPSLPARSLSVQPPPSKKIKQNYKEFDWKLLHVFFPPACYEGMVRYRQPPPLMMMPSAMSGFAGNVHSAHASGDGLTDTHSAYSLRECYQP